MLGPVVVEAEWVHFDQLGHCYLQDLELPDLELELGLQDLELDCTTLHCIHELILSIRISRGRGIGSMHLFSNLLPNQIYLKVFLTLMLCYFHIFKILSFFSFGKIYLTDFTKISQIECYSRFLKAKTHSCIRLLSLHLISILCQHISILPG